MKTTITITVSDEDGGRILAEATPEEVRWIFNDALKEFVDRRQPARDYVFKRYGGTNLDTPAKVDSVERRNQFAVILTQGEVEVNR